MAFGDTNKEMIAISFNLFQVEINREKKLCIDKIFTAIIHPQPQLARITGVEMAVEEIDLHPFLKDSQAVANLEIKFPCQDLRLGKLIPGNLDPGEKDVRKTQGVRNMNGTVLILSIHGQRKQDHQDQGYNLPVQFVKSIIHTHAVWSVKNKDN